jgi:uncharacterized protein YggT (Ycf19 family)
MRNVTPANSDAPTLPDSALRARRPVPHVPPPPRSQWARRPSFVARSSHKIVQAINLLTDVAEALLLLRIVLIFLAADPTAGFARLVYGLSAPLVAPFQGLFPEVVILQGEIDLAAIVAMIAYALGARILQALVRLMARW